MYLGMQQEIYEAPFWFTFIREAERRLAERGVRSRGCAEGDFPLPNCEYASLRNEAFVSVEKGKDPIYPPNDKGWNAANHPCPFLDVMFFLKHCDSKSK